MIRSVLVVALFGLAGLTACSSAGPTTSAPASRPVTGPGAPARVEVAPDPAANEREAYPPVTALSPGHPDGAAPAGQPGAGGVVDSPPPQAAPASVAAAPAQPSYQGPSGAPPNQTPAAGGGQGPAELAPIEGVPASGPGPAYAPGPDGKRPPPVGPAGP